MIAFHTCPKCEGALRLQADAYGAFFTCLMCGAHVTAMCPHCETRSIQVSVGGQAMLIECLACRCTNSALVSEHCIAAQAAV